MYEISSIKSEGKLRQIGNRRMFLYLSQQPQRKFSCRSWLSSALHLACERQVSDVEIYELGKGKTLSEDTMHANDLGRCGHGRESEFRLGQQLAGDETV